MHTGTLVYMHNNMDVEERKPKTKIGSYCALCGLGTARTRECRVLYSCPQVVKNNGGVCVARAMVICVPGRYNTRVPTRRYQRKNIYFYKFLLCAWGETVFVFDFHNDTGWWFQPNSWVPGSSQATRHPGCVFLGSCLTAIVQCVMPAGALVHRTPWSIGRASKGARSQFSGF